MSRSVPPVVALVVAVVAALALFAPSAARAASPLDLGSEAGTMVSQAVRTLGGSFVACKGLVGGSLPDTAQVACARLPGDMFGYFKMGVHGRLYEYLSRGTLHVDKAWHTAGNVLEAVYSLHGGTLTVERERVNGDLYGVFEYQTSAAYASSGSPGH